MLPLVLALSIVGLALGPVIVAVGTGRGRSAATVDGLVLGLVPPLIVLRTFPHLFEELGSWALVLAAFGFLGLWALERRHGHGAVRVGEAVVVPALAAHSLLDGAALAVAFAAPAATGEPAGLLLGVALVIHRVPEGLFVARALVPEVGWRRTIGWLGLLMAATTTGALGGERLMNALPHEPLHAVTAVGLGALLRLVIHTHDPRPRARSARIASGLAFAGGVTLALGIPAPDSLLGATAHPHELSIVESFGPLFVETAPAMLLGLLAAGLLHAFLPQKLAGWLRGGTSLSQAIRGMSFGLPLPICSCGVLPLTRRLLLAGLPTAAVIAFAIGTPELDVGSAFLSYRLLGGPLTVLRIGASAVLAVSVALLVVAATRRRAAAAAAAPRPEAPPAETEAEAEADTQRPPVTTRLKAAWAEATGPALDHIGAWYLVGLLIAASFEAFVDPTLADNLGAPLDVVVSAVIAVPVYVCAQAATPLAAVMIHKGFSPGAALAFLLVGPATNIAMLGVLRHALGTRAAVTFGVSSIVLGVAFGIGANGFVSPASVPEIHDLVAHDHVRIEWICAVLLGAMLLASLVRLGPRAWFGNMLQSAGPTAPEPEPCEDHGHAHVDVLVAGGETLVHLHDHTHDHDHGHEHDHGRNQSGPRHGDAPPRAHEETDDGRSGDEPPASETR